MFKLIIKLALYLVLAIGFSSVRAGAYEDFFKAVTFDDAAEVQGLLARGFDPNSRDEKGQTALYLALREGSLKVAERLLAHPDLRQDLLNAAGESALMMASLKGRLEWVKRLLARNARIEGLDALAWTALHYAATGPEPQVVQALLAHGAKVDARSPNGSTPLMMASRYGAEPSVGLLLQQGADVRLKNDAALTAADFANLAGRESLAKRLAPVAP